MKLKTMVSGLLAVSVLTVGSIPAFRSVYKELHADHETGAADNK